MLITPLNSFAQCKSPPAALDHAVSILKIQWDFRSVCKEIKSGHSALYSEGVFHYSMRAGLKLIHSLLNTDYNVSFNILIYVA